MLEILELSKDADSSHLQTSSQPLVGDAKHVLGSYLRKHNSGTRRAYNEFSDEALVTLISAKNKDAMHALYSRHSVRLYRFIKRLTGNASSAEDVVSDVFLDVWRKSHGFKGQSKASTWLFAIARHKALSALRCRTHDALNDDLETAIDDSAETPETALLGADRRSNLQLCLSKLSAAQREVIDLVYYHEKTIHEVAQIVGVSENTVKTRMHYARHRIRKMLAESGVKSFH